jgi:hypothetical protein
MDQPEDRGWLKKVFEQNKREFNELPTWLQGDKSREQSEDAAGEPPRKVASTIRRD